MFVIKIPSEKALGLNDRDFTNVSTTTIDEDGKVVEGNPEVVFIPTGPLGTLKGGLLHVADYRETLRKEDILKMASAETDANISKKRIGLRFPVVLQPFL